MNRQGDATSAPPAATTLTKSGSVTIAHAIASNFFGGPERQVLTHLRNLAAVGLQPVLVPFMEAERRNELLHEGRAANIRVSPLMAQGAFNPYLVRELAGIIAGEKIDLLVAHGYKANTVCRLASWLKRIPLIAVSRGWTAESARIRLYEWIDRKFLRLADHVVAVSHGQKRKIANLGILPPRVSVIHNCIDLGSYPPEGGTLRTELSLEASEFLVISAGRLSPEKNHAGMIRAARLVCDQRPDVRFAVFGEGAMRRELTALIEKMELTDRFFLLGFHEEVRRLMHECDVFVLPSLTEGLPNVALEAAACRKPIVATRVGGTPEVVQDGVTGILTEAGDDTALAGAILRLLNDRALRISMGENARVWVEKEFSFERQTLAYLDLYCRVLKRQLPTAEGTDGCRC